MSKRLACLLCVTAVALLSGCGGEGNVKGKDRIGSLNKRRVVIDEPVLEDSFEKAMQAYRKFLEEGTENEVTAEAIRRLADLQLEAGSGSYDFVKKVRQGDGQQQDRSVAAGVAQETSDSGEPGQSKIESPIMSGQPDSAKIADAESQKDFEQRSTRISELAPAGAVVLPPGADQNQQEVIVNANTDEAIKLYKKLLEKYPLYERNDQVMYQLARAYEDGGRQEEAMQTMDQLVKTYPLSEHYDEAQFRRGEIFFVRGKYYSAFEAYSEVVNKGQASTFYDQALFKRGWASFKQSAYEDGLRDFMTLLDLKTAAGYHIRTETNKTEYQRVEDTFRVVSLSFSYVGDASAIQAYFEREGHRNY
jgi:tetratricopeptide (TPR) repeat protein